MCIYNKIKILLKNVYLIFVLYNIENGKPVLNFHHWRLRLYHYLLSNLEIGASVYPVHQKHYRTDIMGNPPSSACFEHKNLYPGMSKLNNEESHCHELNCHKLNCIASSSIPISSHSLSDLKMDALV